MRHVFKELGIELIFKESVPEIFFVTDFNVVDVEAIIGKGVVAFKINLQSVP